MGEKMREQNQEMREETKKFLLKLQKISENSC